MKLEKTHIDQIRTAFEKMQSKDDLLNVLNIAKKIVYGDKAIPFQLKQLTWYANPKLGTKRYVEFKIKKKSGAERCIHAPVKGLKSLQKTLSFVLQCVYEPHNAAMGFVRDRSIVDNAKIHIGSKYVYNIDLKDFFPSIDQARVWKCLHLKPFNLNKDYSTLPLEASKPKEAIKMFTTEHGEKIFFKIKDQSITLVIDKKGNLLRYKQRLTSHISKPTSSSLKEGLKHKLSKGEDYNKKVNEILFKDAKRYINSTNNTKQLVELIDSRETLASMIAAICCTEMEVERKNVNGEWEKVKRNVLPQGAPTSPVITNIVCQRLDIRLSGVAKRFGLKYSRYADDITFSSMHNVYQPESEFLKEVHRIIAEQNFHIKESKTRLQKDGYRKEVTGLLVNESVNVQQRYIKQLRMWLYYWERYGYERASGFFLQQYIADKGHVKNGRPDMVNVISGKLDYLKMVKGADNELYLKLKSRFDTLTGKKMAKEIIVNETNIESKFEVVVADKKATKNTLNNDYPILHRPDKTVELLKYFTANDKDLKYSTHSWEEGKYKNYKEYIKKINREWKEINKILKVQSDRLHTKIWAFLFDVKLGHKKLNGYYHVWGEKRLKFGWSSPELRIHMSEPGNSPFSCPIPEHIKQLDKKYNLHYFKDYAEVFKNEIEFREDSNNFKKMILDIWDNELGYDFRLYGLETLIGFSLFTDVALVKASVIKIFEMFKGKPHYPVISIEKISSFENRGFHLFRITQIDSFVTRSIDDPKITNPTGNLNTIIEQLKNLSDYSIVSRFQDGKAYRINYLSTSDTSGFIEKLPDDEIVLGMTHELKFYL
jgi:RNA-directed DNA polymerase